MKTSLVQLLGREPRIYHWRYTPSNKTYYLEPHDDNHRRYLPATMLAATVDLRAAHEESPGYHGNEQFNRLRKFARSRLGMEFDAEFDLSQHGRLQPVGQKDNEEDSLIALFLEGRYIAGFVQYAQQRFDPAYLRRPGQFRRAANRLLVPHPLTPPRLDPRNHLASMVQNSDLPDTVRDGIRELFQ